MNSQLTFKQWIEHTGVNVLADKLGVDESTVRYWRDGRYSPRSSHLHNIIRMAAGKLSYESILAKNGKRKRA